MIKISFIRIGKKYDQNFDLTYGQNFYSKIRRDNNNNNNNNKNPISAESTSR